MHYGNCLLAVSFVAVLAGSGCSREKPAGFVADVQPILNKYCIECHAPGTEGAMESGFLVGSYEVVMKGTKYGPVVVPGSADSSSLYRLLAGEVDPSIQMPHGKQALTAAEIDTIRRWIDQGARGG
ncbi:MAG: c-type cytochrome domain-containing protein [Gammaproteobacteria bacterium]